MKNLILTTGLVLITILQLSANNAPESTSLDVIENEKSVILNLSGLIAGAELFTISDSAGDVVFTDSVEEYEDRVKYNLANLPVGRYTIKVEGAHFVEFHEIMITNKFVEVESVESHFSPTFKAMDEKISVNALFTSEEDIQVTIYNANGDLVYDFSDQKMGSFKKTFNLKHLEKGQYKVIVSTDYFSEVGDISL